MRFVDRLLGRYSISDVTQYEYVGELPCNDGFSIVVRAYNSTLDMMQEGKLEELLIRRYPAMLKLPEGTDPVAFCKQNDINRGFIQNDGTIMFRDIPGELSFASIHIDILATQLEKCGVILPAHEILDMISQEIDKQGEEYMKPVVNKKSNIGRGH